MDCFDIDVYSRKVTTSSPDAQRWFDRGLVWTYSYNHELAIECFQKALQHDVGCAMAHWGVAWAAAMRKAYEAHPHDIDVATIYAEAILNQTPWKMWGIRTNTVAEGAGTVQAQKVLEKFIDTAEGRVHPGILLLYVHLMAKSPTPERALMAGDRLRELVPDAGDLIHMPTHIDIWNTRNPVRKLCGNPHGTPDVQRTSDKAVACGNGPHQRQDRVNRGDTGTTVRYMSCYGILELASARGVVVSLLVLK